METPQQNEVVKSVVSTARSQQETHDSFYEKAKLKIDLFELDQPLQETFYQDTIQKLLVCVFIFYRTKGSLINLLHYL